MIGVYTQGKQEAESIHHIHANDNGIKAKKHICSNILFNHNPTPSKSGVSALVPSSEVLVEQNMPLVAYLTKIV